MDLIRKGAYKRGGLILILILILGKHFMETFICVSSSVFHGEPSLATSKVYYNCTFV